jgi:GH18 family chitinase
MPRPIANAVCGPQVPGTIKPSSGTNISELNPCPLNACCDVWGQCGITAEFCTPSGTGAPGTAAKNTNGCISNCGTRITNNGKAPAARISIAYFEAWNRERPCLWKDVSQVDAARFTHIHFAFAKITPQYTVDTSRVQSQLDRFVRLKGIKRIVAFGGWADSTSVDSYYIFRQGVKPGNRLVLARNLANFVKEHGLDGVDIDWEYPGAQDLPDIPPAEAIDGEGYVAFLTLLRALLPSGTSLSIAAPASYWYLKNYPIKRISEVVDYIVYMTYDLHGQWDYANQWSIDGCPAGNCLRSHVNLTETMTSLAMITKAGVATNKIVVGVSSYGRSFKMSKAGCYGPMCTFEGPKSGAKPGICTGEPGYISNAEINEIVSGGAKRVTKDFLDEGSHSRIIVYDDTHYVAFMDEEIKSQRTTIYKILNFAGTSDWADDLREFSEAEQWTPGIFTEINSTLTCGWRSTDGFNCMKDAVKDVTMDQTDRWRAVKTDCAWREFAWDFKFAAKGMYLPAFASGYFDGPEGFNCEEVGGCVHNVLCIETVDSGPAGSFILNSFVEINKVGLSHDCLSQLISSELTHPSQALKIFFDGIISAQTQMNSLLGAFSETFAPELTNDGSFNIVMDIFGLTFTLLAGPVFNNRESFSHSFYLPVDQPYSLKAYDSTESETILRQTSNSQGQSERHYL